MVYEVGISWLQSWEDVKSIAVPDKILGKSEWRDEESVTKWRNLAAHRMAQASGRMNDFADYKITVVTPLRSYTMTERSDAPKDSNKYFEI